MWVRDRCFHLKLIKIGGWNKKLRNKQNEMNRKRSGKAINNVAPRFNVGKQKQKKEEEKEKEKEKAKINNTVVDMVVETLASNRYPFIGKRRENGRAYSDFGSYRHLQQHQKLRSSSSIRCNMFPLLFQQSQF